MIEVENPLVSVLLTCYNAEDFIEQAIESVLSQTYQNWELLILDDCSRDKTREIINSFPDPRIRKIFTETNIGYVRSKNILLKEFKGNFACFLDADDWMASERISRQLGVFNEFPKVGACMCNYVRVMPDGVEKRMDFYHQSKFLDYKTDDLNFAGSGIMFRKEVYTKIGGFELYFDKLLGDDSYWAFKIAEKFPFYFLKDSLYYYRANANSITASFTNLRKLTVVELLKKLRQQRRETGTDWIQNGETDAALNYEKYLMTKRKWLGESYRVAAAVRLDYGDKKAAFKYLVQAFKLNPLSVINIATLRYFLNP